MGRSLRLWMRSEESRFPEEHKLITASSKKQVPEFETHH